MSDGDTSAATTEDHDILGGRWGGHGGRGGRREGMNIEGCRLYILGAVDDALSKSRDLAVIGREDLRGKGVGTGREVNLEVGRFLFHWVRGIRP